MVLFRIIWEVPQNILGFIYLMYLFKNNKITDIEYVNNKGLFLIINSDQILPIVLGIFLFFPKNSHINKRLIERSNGYSNLSFLSGPLYIILFFIPSFIWYILKIKLSLFKNIPYNSFYTEKLSKYFKEGL